MDTRERRIAIARPWIYILLALLAWARPVAARGLDLGIRGNAMLFQIEKGPGVLPTGDIEVGYVPDLLEERVRIALVWGGGAIAFSRQGADGQLFTEKGRPGLSYSGSIALHAVCLSLEVGIRLLPWSRRASPYIVWRPRVLLLRTVTDLTVDQMELGRVQEWKWYPTAEGGLGLEIRMGTGQLFTELTAGFFPLYNDTVGNATGLSLVVSIGYRHLFRR